MRVGDLPIEEQLAHFQAALGENPTLIEVLNRAVAIDLPGWYLVAGCLYQTVWNVVTGQPAEAGILDYDLAYFDDSDLSWEAEDTVIREGNRVFDGLPAPVQIRNQARVHLWYEAKFGLPCPLHPSTEAAIGTFEAMVACLGVRLEPGGRWRVHAPFGLSDVFNLVVRPNPVLAPRHVYQAKTDRWRRQWPELTVLPWPGSLSQDQFLGLAGWTSSTRCARPLVARTAPTSMATKKDGPTIRRACTRCCGHDVVCERAAGCSR